MKTLPNLAALCPLMVLLTVPSSSQSAQDALWTGQVQCQLNVRTNDYAHQEVQTWTVTGSPTDDTKTVYPATWSVTGQGGLQRSQGAQVLAGRWNSSVPGMSAPLRIFVRASDGRLVIKGIHSLLVAPGATNVIRQVGASQTNVVYAAGEWTLPIIEDVGTSTNVSGSGTTIVAPTSMPMQPGTSGTATCKWNFTKGGSAPGAVNIDGTQGSQLSIPRVTVHPGQVANKTTVTPTTATVVSNPSGTPQAPPSLAGIAPGTAPQGAKDVQVGLTGVATHFAQGMTKADFGPGIQVTGLQVASPTSAVATLTVNPDATAGMHPVVMTTGNETVTSPNGFSVTLTMSVTNLPTTPLALPGIQQINPNSAVQEATGLSVTLTGFSTHFATNSTVADFGPGVTVSSLTVNSPTQATAVLNVDAAAATTTRDVTLKTGNEAAVLRSGFTVSVPPPPAIVSVNPNSAEPGEPTLAVTINAQSTHFAAGTTKLDFGPGVTVTSLGVNSRTQATAVLAISPSAAATTRTLTATTGSEVAKGGQFVVTTNPGQIVQVLPASGAQQQQLTLQVIGSGTHFSTNSSVSINGLCQFEGVSQVTRTTMNARMSCPPTTPTGPQPVSVISNGHTISLYNAFTITPQPDFYGHDMNMATNFGMVQPGQSKTISGWLDSNFDSNWFWLGFPGSTQIVVTLKDVSLPSNFLMDAFSASSTHAILTGSSNPTDNGLQKTLTFKDDGSHAGVLLQIHPNAYDVRNPKFTLIIQGIYVPLPLTYPTPFTFTDKHLAVPFQMYTSDSVVIQGINVGVPIYMENGGLYNINGGAYTGRTGTVYNGDRISLQGDVNATDIKYFYTVHVGDYSVSWMVTVLP